MKAEIEQIEKDIAALQTSIANAQEKVGEVEKPLLRGIIKIGLSTFQSSLKDATAQIASIKNQL